MANTASTLFIKTPPARRNRTVPFHSVILYEGARKISPHLAFAPFEFESSVMTLSLSDIEKAQNRIAGGIVKTPSAHSITLSEITGADVFLKFENFQFTASFKERGALNKLLSLDAKARAKGIVAMSAGNHAQGVAYHASRLNIPATIIMPENTPFNKVQNTARFGAETILTGKTFTEASQTAHEILEQRNLTLVHPFNDESIIAGQGTVALEFLEACDDLDVLVVPIGGGGLISGIATAAKALKPGIKIIGVQSELYPGMKRAIDGVGDVIGGHSVAEGIAVKDPGDITRAIVADLVDDILIVSEFAIEDAINTLLEIEKVVVEGAGAAALAALLQYPEKFTGKKTGLILTGGNIDSRLLATALMRGLARSGRISRLRIMIPDIPGMLALVSATVAEKGANVLEVEHQREFADLTLKQAVLNLVIETQDHKSAEEIVRALNDKGLEVEISGAAVRN